MQLTFLGGADEVGASCTLIEIGGKQILVDAGIRISPRSNRGIQNSQLPDLQPISAAGGPDYILVTHAHTDHTGALPLILEQYPNAPVLATQASIDLTRVLQLDAQRIMKSRHEQEGELPLFDEIAVQRLMDAFQPVRFNNPIRLGEGVQVTYHTAGHIAGAAMLVLESEEGTLVMSGDVSLSPQRTVQSLQVPRVKADALVLESTYGGKLHANRDAEEKRLIENLKRVTERGGKVLIPAFALGRAQEVVQIILAYHDQLDIPVYVDGMVRSVCNAYVSFSDILPEHTVHAAGDDHLFFRKKIKPIRSQQHRMEVAMSDTPVVVVASSGMLTGGASVAYAAQFAPDERNAIFMTGYQDEEAPGRFLQRMMKEREEGATPTLKLDDKTVKVRCEIGTYSLSAHADEAELVSVAQALKASEVILVHGDPGARHSLASALRQRQINVITPKIGQTRQFSFKKRPWGIGTLKSGKQAGAPDLKQLWESLQDSVGGFFSIRELAQVWWGSYERADEMQQALTQQDNIYFVADWRNKKTFQVRTAEQVERSQKQRAIMLANPDIVGKLIVMRNSNNQPRLAIVNSADIDSFDAIVHNTKGTHFPADALLWVIGEWEGTGEGKGKKSQLSAMMQAAQKLKDVILPYSQRQQLVTLEMPVLPDSLLPDEFPEGVSRQLALVTIVVALAEDRATLEQGGLRPQRAMEHGPVEQNQARDIVMSTFPPQARLRKSGMDIHRKRLMLTFDFPDTAPRLYSDEIERVKELTGWDVHIRPTTNQQALGIAVEELLPDGASITKGPSFHMNRREVQVDVDGVADPKALQTAFTDLTGYALRIGDSAPPTASNQSPVTPTAENGTRMEINAAYGLIKSRLNEHGLYKTSLKQGNIVLSFISPQVGERHQETINQLAKEVGYPLSIHPHPNQAAILQVASKLLRDANIPLTKGPGIHTDRSEIAIKVADELTAAELEALNSQLEEQTGYQFEVS